MVRHSWIYACLPYFPSFGFSTVMPLSFATFSTTEPVDGRDDMWRCNIITLFQIWILYGCDCATWKKVLSFSRQSFGFPRTVSKRSKRASEPFLGGNRCLVKPLFWLNESFEPRLGGNRCLVSSLFCLNQSFESSILLLQIPFSYYFHHFRPQFRNPKSLRPKFDLRY